MKDLKLIRFLVVAIGLAFVTLSVTVVVIATMSVAAIRLDLDGLRIDDVVDFLMTSGFVVVANIVGVQLALGIVTIASLVLAIVGVVIIVLYTPVKIVIGGMLR